MFQGSIVALVTPMTTNGEVDYSALAELIEFHINEGTNAIVSVGTTGESATLNTHEHMSVVSATCKQVRGRIPVIAGTGANSTSEAIELTSEAKRIGVDACLLVVPYYNKPTQRGMIEHFSAVAKAVGIPQILYNVPSRTVADMLPTTTIELSKISNIVGIKEASGDNSRVSVIIEGTAPGFCLLSGEDVTIAEFLELGGKGIISVTANVAPSLMQQMCSAFSTGDNTRGRALHDKLLPLHKAMFVESNPIAVKYALYVMGKISLGIRLPMTWLDEQYHEQVDSALRKLDII